MLPWPMPQGLVAGVDEAGRGPLAGPVVAAAVILDERQPIAGLADSKKLTALRRERLFDEIRAKALCCSVAEASVEEIDRLNILQATLLAMRRAVQGLRLKPGLVLVRGVATDGDLPQFVTVPTGSGDLQPNVPDTASPSRVELMDLPLLTEAEAGEATSFYMAACSLGGAPFRGGPDFREAQGSQPAGLTATPGSPTCP